MSTMPQIPGPQAGLMNRLPFLLAGLAAVNVLLATPISAGPKEDQKTLAALDTKYQQAVKDNDAQTMDGILADNFVLVTGNGRHFTKADLLQEAKSATTHYEHQEDTEQTVRVWGDTGVITAKLWVKGTERGRPVEYVLWFSDTYVRTPGGWRYVFGQASLPLNDTMAASRSPVK
jgi:ketosteroid isomerase-like protein